jgi:hypothetical protein
MPGFTSARQRRIMARNAALAEANSPAGQERQRIAALKQDGKERVLTLERETVAVQIRRDMEEWQEGLAYDPLHDLAPAEWSIVMGGVNEFLETDDQKDRINTRIRSVRAKLFALEESVRSSLESALYGEKRGKVTAELFTEHGFTPEEQATIVENKGKIFRPQSEVDAQLLSAHEVLDENTFARLFLMKEFAPAGTLSKVPSETLLERRIAMLNALRKKPHHSGIGEYVIAVGRLLLLYPEARERLQIEPLSPEEEQVLTVSFIPSTTAWTEYFQKFIGTKMAFPEAIKRMPPLSPANWSNISSTFSLSITAQGVPFAAEIFKFVHILFPGKAHLLKGKESEFWKCFFEQFEATRVKNISGANFHNQRFPAMVAARALLTAKKVRLDTEKGITVKR